MDKKKINQNANNIMWVEYWIGKAHPSYKDYELSAERYDDYRWVCEIELPLINKTVKAISEKEVNAMLGASKKAAKLIDSYMREHPELHIENSFKGKRWEIQSDETGKYISTGMSAAWRKEQGDQMMKQNEKCIKVVKKAIAQLVRIKGSSKNLFIQVVDQSLFDDDMTIQEILFKIQDKIEKEYGYTDINIVYDRDGNSVIAVGSTLSNDDLMGGVTE